MLILPQFVEMTWTANNKNQFEEKGYLYTKQNDTFQLNVLHLSRFSAKSVNVKCDKCGTIYSKPFKNIGAHRDKEDICEECINEKIEKICETCNKKFYVVNSRKDRAKYCSKKCIGVHQPNKIKTNCANCGEEIEKVPSQIKENNFCSNKCVGEYNGETRKTGEYINCKICNEKFYIPKNRNESAVTCSKKCQNVWQSLFLTGENANGYKAEYTIEDRTTNCNWCDTPFQIQPGKVKEKNNLNLFCSEYCKREWFAKEWSQQEEWKEISRIRAVKMLEDGIITTDTWCQIEVNKILKKLEIEFKNEYNCKYVSIDNYLSDYNLMIEVMGTYWHTDPRFYNQINYQMQVDRIKNDKIKHTYILNNYGIEILYLWEDDIKNNIELCSLLIESYIKNKGILSNYHSLNYEIINSKEIKIKDDIIKTYMEYDIDDLKKIIDIKTKRRSMKQQERWLTFNCDYCGNEKEQLICHYNKASHHYCSDNCRVKGRVGMKLKKRVKKQ